MSGQPQRGDRNTVPAGDKTQLEKAYATQALRAKALKNKNACLIAMLGKAGLQFVCPAHGCVSTFKKSDLLYGHIRSCEDSEHQRCALLINTKFCRGCGKTCPRILQHVYARHKNDYQFTIRTLLGKNIPSNIIIKGPPHCFKVDFLSKWKSNVYSTEAFRPSRASTDSESEGSIQNLLLSVDDGLNEASYVIAPLKPDSIAGSYVPSDSPEVLLEPGTTTSLPTGYPKARAPAELPVESDAHFPQQPEQLEHPIVNQEAFQSPFLAENNFDFNEFAWMPSNLTDLLDGVPNSADESIFNLLGNSWSISNHNADEALDNCANPNDRPCP